VDIHCELEAWPEEHGCCIYVGIYSGDLAALKGKCEVLIQAHT